MATDRRNWSIHEEDVLITILQVAMKMREKIPGINITPKHIQNKMKRFKDKYSAAYDMLNTSGFGWDDTNQCVTVDDQVLQEYLKKHPSKNYIANKPFPQYERLKTVFGKDRATGSLAESAADAMEHINLENEAGAETEEFTVPLSTPSNGASESSIPQEGEASSKKRKRKVGAKEDAIKVIEKGLDKLSTEMGNLVAIVGTPGLQSLPDELMEMGFDFDQSLAISRYFAGNPIELRLWSGMNANLKPRFVRTILADLGK